MILYQFTYFNNLLIVTKSIDLDLYIHQHINFPTHMSCTYKYYSI